MQHTFKTQQPFKLNARLSHMVTHLFLILEERNSVCLSVCVCMCVVAEITGDVMEHGEPQPHWLYSSQTKIALLWFTAHIHASDSKYQPVNRFYKLYSIHIRVYVQSGTLWLPYITNSASMSRNLRNTVRIFWIKSAFMFLCIERFHKVYCGCVLQLSLMQVSKSLYGLWKIRINKLLIGVIFLEKNSIFFPFRAVTINLLFKIYLRLTFQDTGFIPTKQDVVVCFA